MSASDGGKLMSVSSMEFGRAAVAPRFAAPGLGGLLVRLIGALPRPFRFLAVGGVGLATDLAVLTLVLAYWPHPLLARLVSLAVATSGDLAAQPRLHVRPQRPAAGRRSDALPRRDRRCAGHKLLRVRRAGAQRPRPLPASRGRRRRRGRRADRLHRPSPRLPSGACRSTAAPSFVEQTEQRFS